MNNKIKKLFATIIFSLLPFSAWSEKIEKWKNNQADDKNSFFFTFGGEGGYILYAFFCFYIFTIASLNEVACKK